MADTRIKEEPENKEPLPKKAKKKHGLFHTKKEPRKALSTFLRNQNKFIVSSIAIADRKAMILIRINSTLLSALIVFYDYLDINIKMGGIMSVVLIIGSGCSLTFAILAAKPFGLSVLRKFNKEIKPNHPELSENNFMLIKSNTSFKEYETSMNEVVQSQELQIGNQVRANYLFQTSMRKKFLLLDVAYNIFLVAFLAVVLIFFISKLIL